MQSSIFIRRLLRPCLLPNYMIRYPARAFHSSPKALAVKPFLLADIGEGIRECEIIQWFVEPGARVEEFDKICEVQSDKASVDIPSRFSGVIKKLHYEAGQMAIVGKPLVDIDVPDEVQEDNTSATGTESNDASRSAPETPQPIPASNISRPSQGIDEMIQESPEAKKGKHAALATPAVRHLSKELDVDIGEVSGTGRDGRVTKDDINKFAAARDSDSGTSGDAMTSGQSFTPRTFDDGPQKETVTQLTKIQAQMFKTMTRSLSIPHFLYGDEIDFTALLNLRQRLNALAKSSADQNTKISMLPFIVKAMSLALTQYPILNARVKVDNDNGNPTLIMRSQHNIGIAMDTPQGLIVPVVKNVASLDILSIDRELKRLQSLASKGKLSAADLTGGTITLSNVGNIGGSYVSPVIVDTEVAILGMAKLKTIPAFDEAGNIVKKQVSSFSWCADHRVVDGATMARAAEVVRGFVESPDTMLVYLR